MTLNELYHHGILGMKWGVRRYQNEDGSLTNAGKKRYLSSDGQLNERGKKQISSQYKNYSVKAQQSWDKKSTEEYVKAYNKTADYMNSGGIEKFDNAQKKKYGENFSKRSGYMDDYNKQFDELFTKAYNKSVSDFYNSNPDYKKAQSLVKQYSMESWDELAKQNSGFDEELKKYS